MVELGIKFILDLQKQFKLSRATGWKTHTGASDTKKNSSHSQLYIHRELKSESGGHSKFNET